MMVLHPDVLHKAQAEIDQVVGLERLPTFADQHRLPYLNALIKELLRINPVTSMVPHSLAQDSEYRGFRIPKGACVSANNWCAQLQLTMGYYFDPFVLGPFLTTRLCTNIRNNSYPRSTSEQIRTLILCNFHLGMADGEENSFPIQHQRVLRCLCQAVSW